MKNAKPIRLLLILALLGMLFFLFACGGGDASGTTDSNGVIAPGTTTEAPSAYTVRFSVNGEISEVRTERGEIPVFSGSTARADDWKNYYFFEGWDRELAPATADVTYTAVYRELRKDYRITFLVDGQKKVVAVDAGELPVCPIEPVKASDAMFEYRFVGWDREPTEVNGNATYTAQFDAVQRSYRISFLLPGGSTTETCLAGTMPVFRGSTDVEVGDGSYAVRFVGWDREVTAALADAVYTACYTVELHGSAVYTDAALTKAKGGAKAVVSMTFDDGIYDTALLLDDWFAKYHLCGSCMLIAGNNIGVPFTEANDKAAMWQALFAHGNLEPESHTMTHMPLPLRQWTESTERPETLYHNTQKNYRYELAESRLLLKRYFPDYDFLTLAPAHNSLSTYSFATDEAGTLLTDESGNYIPVQDGGADAFAATVYYAIRRGASGEIQSLSPATDSHSPGSWANLYMVSLDTMTDAASGKSYLDACVRNGGWFVGMCHAIRDAEGSLHPDVAREFFAYIGHYVDSGEVWCASFTEATRYLRLRQNSSVSAVIDGNLARVFLTIDRDTADGLYLTEDVFDVPLTVQIEVPAEWKSVSYRLGTETVTADVRTENGSAYVLVDVLPGGDGQTTVLDVNRVGS